MSKKNDKLANKESFEKFAGKLQVDKETLSKVVGGAPGKGWISTISGDCFQNRGRDCWGLLWPF